MPGAELVIARLPFTLDEERRLLHRYAAAVGWSAARPGERQG